MLLAVAAACAGETVEVPGETVVVEKVVTETVEVPGETVVVEKEVIKTVEVPGETVTKEVVKEVMVPGETVVVEKEVVKTVEVPGQTVVVEKEVVKEVPMGYVTDPTTGKVVSAPQYGGTITSAYITILETTDPHASGHFAGDIYGVNQQLAVPDWGIDRDVYDFSSGYFPIEVAAGQLAESWETPDDTTIVLNIRKGVHYALDPDSEASRLVNGRELTADDVVYSIQRHTAQGSFTERPVRTYEMINLPWESIEATDKYTVVIKMKEFSLTALRSIITESAFWILPPEVIQKYGNYEDWKNVVGTGPLMLTDWSLDISKTWTKNPDYWGYDPKYPQNRVPYVDEIRALYMPEAATRLSAIRTGKIDFLGMKVDVARSLQKTNPEIVRWPTQGGVGLAFGLNTHKPPFDDIRVRQAMQMALDLETINDTYYGGMAGWKPQGGVGKAVVGYNTSFDEFPEEVKQYYIYDPEGAEKLLDEAGYPRGADGVRLKVHLHHRDVGDLGYAEIAVSYWREIGVDVDVGIYDTPSWVAARADPTLHELSTSYQAFNYNPESWVTYYRTDYKHRYEYVGGYESPEMDALYDAFFAAKTFEEQQRIFKEFDMVGIKRHNQVWGPVAPGFMAAQPWVIGYNAEGTSRHLPFIHLWIDQEMKEAMGH